MKKLLSLLVFSVLSYGLHAQQITPPSFDGDFDTWLRENAKFPETALADGLTGPVEVRAGISKVGRAQRVNVVKYPHPAIRDEVARIMKEIHFVPALKDGNPIFKSVDITLDLTRLLDPEVARGLTVVDSLEMPKWVMAESGKPGFTSWLIGQYAVPPHLEGTEFSKIVDITFTVNTEGFVENVVVESDDDPLCEEILRVVRTSPKWQPALVNGLPHRFTMSQKINLSNIEKLYDYVNDMPKFTKRGNGMKNFHDWVASHIKYPKNTDLNSKARVIARFTVEKDGNVGKIEILQSPGLEFSEEVIRVIKQSPTWYSPGMYNGEPVGVNLNIPVIFKP